MNAEIIYAVIAAVVALVGGFWAILTIAATQFEKRLETKFRAFTDSLEQLRAVGTQRLEKLEANYGELDKMVRQILIELPREYVARTDYIRHETLIEAKIDQVRLHMEKWFMRNGRSE